VIWLQKASLHFQRTPVTSVQTQNNFSPHTEEQACACNNLTGHDSQFCRISMHMQMVKRILLPYGAWIIPRWVLTITGMYKPPAKNLVYCLSSTNTWLKLKRWNHEYFPLFDKKTEVNHNSRSLRIHWIPF